MQKDNSSNPILKMNTPHRVQRSFWLISIASALWNMYPEPSFPAMDEGFRSCLSEFCEGLKSVFDSHFANRILLVTVHQVVYPITPEELYKFWDDPGVTDFELENRLEDSGDLEVFDKMVVRKIKVQDVDVKDDEVTMDDESMETNGGLRSSIVLSSVEHCTQPSSLLSMVQAVMKEGLDASFKVLSEPLKDKVPAIFDEPIQDICGQPKDTTRNKVSKVDSKLVTFDVYHNITITCNVDPIMLEIILNDRHQFRDVEFVHIENTTKAPFLRRMYSGEKFEWAYSKVFTNANKFIEMNDPYGLRLLVMENNNVVVDNTREFIELKFTLKLTKKFFVRSLDVGVDILYAASVERYRSKEFITQFSSQSKTMIQGYFIGLGAVGFDIQISSYLEDIFTYVDVFVVMITNEIQVKSALFDYGSVKRASMGEHKFALKLGLEIIFSKTESCCALTTLEYLATFVKDIRIYIGTNDIKFQFRASYDRSNRGGNGIQWSFAENQSQLEVVELVTVWKIRSEQFYVSDVDTTKRMSVVIHGSGSFNVQRKLEIEARFSDVNDLALATPIKQNVVITGAVNKIIKALATPIKQNVVIIGVLDKLIKVCDVVIELQMHNIEGHEALIYSFLPNCKESIHFILPTSVDDKIETWEYDSISARIHIDALGLVEWNEIEGVVKRNYHGFCKNPLVVVQFSSIEEKFLVAANNHVIRIRDLYSILEEAAGVIEYQLLVTVFHKIRIPTFGMEKYELNGKICFQGGYVFANIVMDEMMFVHAAVLVKAKRALGNIWSNHLKEVRMVKVDQGLVFKGVQPWKVSLILEDKDCFQSREYCNEPK
ncbi:hypothetical protein GQ457_16G008030 [Hibiscus cannabinus]